ncbi:bifunctional hydroxymethylpyrimidine kinase/phosphomethylpyrimidine kinase [Acuticoccus sp.]|uniref:bifunctional hydroxymethylpyrimidine kinase/phosphomethylpyrimidine kinase n=1 Tax=Acuticoccus sp. TaxID=1904378 RepID=UPI003B51D5CD
MGAGTVVAISSTVMRGAVGLRPITFALERRGATVWAVPTVLLPWHPGLGPSTRTPNTALAAHLADLAEHAGEADGVLTGYFASAEQVQVAAGFIDRVRAVRDALVLVDPVSGDERGRYVPDDVLAAIRTHLVPRADILTPNVHELADLGGAGDPVTAAHATGVATVVVTSAWARPERIQTLQVEQSSVRVVEHARIEPAPRGTGDLFSAVYLSARLSGEASVDALRQAAAATLAVVRASDGPTLALAAAQAAIAAPPTCDVVLRDHEP